MTKNFSILRYTLKVNGKEETHYFFLPCGGKTDGFNVIYNDFITSKERVDIKLKIIVEDLKGYLPAIEFTEEDIARGEIYIKHIKTYEFNIIGTGCENISSDGAGVWIRPRCKDIIIGSGTISVYVGANSHDITIGPDCSTIFLHKTGTSTRIGANVHNVFIKSPEAGVIFIDENQGEEGGKLFLKGGKDYIVRDSFHRGVIDVKG